MFRFIAILLLMIFIGCSSVHQFVEKDARGTYTIHTLSVNYRGKLKCMVSSVRIREGDVETVKKVQKEMVEKRD